MMFITHGRGSLFLHEFSVLGSRFFIRPPAVLHLGENYPQLEREAFAYLSIINTFGRFIAAEGF